MSAWMETQKLTFSKSVSKRSNLCRNDSYIFGQKHVSVSKLHCVEIVCVEVTGTLYMYLAACTVFYKKNSQINNVPTKMHLSTD